MKSAINYLTRWLLFLTVAFFYGCTDLELNEKAKLPNHDIDLSSRAVLSKKLRDSTNNAESLVANLIPESDNSVFNQLSSTSVNYAPQATVTAESTYPGYSVQKIKDGSRNTTVGPSYSWANNFPAGGKLPESVFLKFSSLKSVDRIDIYTSSGYALQNYTIQYRVTTTGSWINLVVVTGNTSVVRSHTFATVNLLEVQIICQLGPNNQTIYGRLNEVEIYGPAEPTLPYIQNQNGILTFSSATDVEKAIAYLEYKYDQYSEAFASQYSNLTADQFADIEETVGFNDDQPYINFENQYGIYSLRASLTAQEDYWLENTAGDETAGVDPDDLYMNDYEFRTLVNSDGYLKVGSLYYVFLSDGSYYTYDGGGGGGGCTIDCPIQLASIKNLKKDDPLPKGVKYYQSEPTISIYLAAPGCRSNVKKKGFQPNGDGTWRFKWKVKSSDGPFSGPGRVKAITKSYKKKNGRWKKRGATIGAQVLGNVVSQDCTGGGYVESAYAEKRRRKIKAKVSVQNLAVKNGELRGFHYHEKAGSYNSTLTW
jgi:hypothetical protein